MFIVEPKTAGDLQVAMFICSYYHVHMHAYSDGERAGSVYLHVSMDDQYAQDESLERAQENFRLCEMAFQGEFHQKSHYLCAACKAEIERTGEGQSTCGHLTFTEVI